MPDGYDGLNFGTFYFYEFTDVLFQYLTETYYHSLSVEDLLTSVDPIDISFSSADAAKTDFVPIDSTESIYSPISSATTSFTPVQEIKWADI